MKNTVFAKIKKKNIIDFLLLAQVQQIQAGNEFLPTADNKFSKL